MCSANRSSAAISLNRLRGRCAASTSSVSVGAVVGCEQAHLVGCELSSDRPHSREYVVGALACSKYVKLSLEVQDRLSEEHRRSLSATPARSHGRSHRAVVHRNGFGGAAAAVGYEDVVLHPPLVEAREWCRASVDFK
jgi:hypothetical protein